MKLWIARDENGDLYLYTSKPKKIAEEWEADDYSFSRNSFPEIKWEDEEPTEVELKIVKKNESNSN